MDLLKNAIDLLKNGKIFSVEKSLKKPLEIDLHVSSLLPSSYILDINTRLFFYKKLANAIHEKQIEEIKYELIDQFGKLPDFSKNLILIVNSW